MNVLNPISDGNILDFTDPIAPYFPPKEKTLFPDVRESRKTEVKTAEEPVNTENGDSKIVSEVKNIIHKTEVLENPDRVTRFMVKKINASRASSS